MTTQNTTHKTQLARRECQLNLAQRLGECRTHADALIALTPDLDDLANERAYDAYDVIIRDLEERMRLAKNGMRQLKRLRDADDDRVENPDDERNVSFRISK